MPNIEYGKMHYRLGTIGDQEPAPASIYDPSPADVRSLYGKKEYPLTNYELDTSGALEVDQKPITERRGNNFIPQNDIVAVRKNETLKTRSYHSEYPFTSIRATPDQTL